METIAGEGIRPLQMSSPCQGASQVTFVSHRSDGFSSRGSPGNGEPVHVSDSPFRKAPGTASWGGNVPLNSSWALEAECFGAAFGSPSSFEFPTEEKRVRQTLSPIVPGGVNLAHTVHLTSTLDDRTSGL